MIATVINEEIILRINKNITNSKTSSYINDTVSDNNGSEDNKNYNLGLMSLINDKYNINDATISYIDHIAGGDITANHSIFSEINNNEASKKILDYDNYGIPIIKMRNSGKKVMIISGIHGNELPPQVAIINLIREVVNVKINGKLYIVPFKGPKASMNNSRWFDSIDLNRNTYVGGSPSNIILKKSLS